jgi:beta-N-acetylhexosaminidase
LIKGRTIRVLITFLTVFLLGTETIASVPTFFSLPSGDPAAEQRAVEKLIGSMDDTELLGQLFLLSYFGGSPSREILYWIEERKIGGVKIFGWNANDLEELSRSIVTMQQRAAASRHGIPLFIATDQEGGWVRHVKSSTSITPGNLAIGATGLPYDAYWSGFYIGEELKMVGINMNFAPTVDVYSNREAHVIGPRSFSSDPRATAKLAVAYFEGMKKAGIVCTAKHFPGHGAADEDSHGTLPKIAINISTLWERELLPYRFLIRKDLPAVMSGHLSFPLMEDENTPASLSSFFLREILRRRMGFDGIIITDDMRMNAAIGVDYSIANACLRAFNAGNDMIMISPDQDVYREVWRLFSRELALDENFRKRVKESVGRILLTKLRYFRREDSVPIYPDPALVAEQVPTEEAEQFFFEQACRSVSVIKGEGIPIRDEGEDTLIVGQLRSFLAAGKRFFPEADTLYFPYTPFYDAAQSTVRRVARRAESYKRVIFCLANPNSAEVLDGLRDSDTELIVLSTLTPVYLSERLWVDGALAVYGTGEDSAVAGFAALKGMIKGEGKLPVSIGFEEFKTGGEESR